LNIAITAAVFACLAIPAIPLYFEPGLTKSFYLLVAGVGAAHVDATKAIRGDSLGGRSDDVPRLERHSPNPHIGLSRFCERTP